MIMGVFFFFLLAGWTDSLGDIVLCEGSNQDIGRYQRILALAWGDMMLWTYTYVRCGTYIHVVLAVYKDKDKLNQSALID